MDNTFIRIGSILLVLSGIGIAFNIYLIEQSMWWISTLTIPWVAWYCFKKYTVKESLQSNDIKFLLCITILGMFSVLAVVGYVLIGGMKNENIRNH